MSLAVGYFGSHGYTVSIPLTDTQWYDLVVERDGKFYTVQCKGTTTDYLDLRTRGGTKLTTTSHALDYPIDYIFCASNGECFLIPAEAIREYGVNSRFSLHPTSDRGLNTEQYKVDING